MKKLLAALLISAMAAGVLTGCGAEKEAPAAPETNKEEAAETAEETEETGELRDFNVILDWFPNAIHSFMYVAAEKGYFAEEGLNVTLTAPAGYSDGITFPAAGKAEAGLYYMNDCTVGFADEGMDIEVIGAVTQDTLSCMIALKEKNILTPADFRGKKVGYSGGEVLKQELITVAEEAGVAEDEFELIDIGFDIETSIVSGAVDVAAGGMVNNEVIELENAGYEIDHWMLDDYGIPHEYDILVVVNKTAYEADPDLYEGFLNACRKGFDDVKADPEAALDVLFAHEDAENYALNRDVEAGSLGVLLGIEEESGVPFLSMSKDVWNANTEWLVEKGLLKNKVDASDFTNAE